MNIFSRRQLLVSSNINISRYTKPQVKLQPQHLPPLAVHAILLANMYQEFKEIYPTTPTWIPIHRKYISNLLDAYDSAVAQIEDEDLKEWFISQMEHPIE